MQVLIGILVLIFIISASLYKKVNRHNGSNYLLFAFLLIAFWGITYILYIVEIIPINPIIWYLLGYIGKSLATICLWIFAIKYTNPHVKIRQNFVFTLFIIPIFTLIFAVTNMEKGVIFSFIDIIKSSPNKEIYFEKNIWFYIDYLYNLLAIIFPILIFIKQYNYAPVISKMQYLMSILGYTCILIFDIVFVLQVRDNFEIRIIGMAIGSLIVYWSLIKYKASDLVVLVRDAVFEKISCICLLIENNGKILDFNPEAKKIFGFVSNNLEGMLYDDLKKMIISEKNALFEKVDEGEMLQFDDGYQKMYFIILSSPIIDKSNVKIGTFLEFRDVTRQQQLICELDYIANYDQLTKLHNRRYFEYMCEIYDNKKFYPLAIITGDLNKLKFTNDKFGHKVGDDLIVLASKILKEAAPSNAVVSRHGGDEFCILIPNTSNEDVKKYINLVYDRAKKSTKHPFGNISISLGYCIKSNDEESISDTIEKADKNMYNVKKNQKNFNIDFR